MFFQKQSFIDGTWSSVDLTIWTQLETGTYLMSACLMTYRPLLERFGSRRLFSKKPQRPNSIHDGLKKFTRPSTDVVFEPRVQTAMSSFTLREEASTDSQILVTTNIEVAHSQDSIVSWLAAEGSNAV